MHKYNSKYMFNRLINLIVSQITSMFNRLINLIVSQITSTCSTDSLILVLPRSQAYWIVYLMLFGLTLFTAEVT